MKEQGYTTGLIPEKDRRICESSCLLICETTNVDITLGPEMKSTGEVMGKDLTLEKALYKGLSGIWNSNSKIRYRAY